MDFPISYLHHQLISAERSYTTTEFKGLSMVYAVNKFWHYQLANKFIFFVDHHALLYLVNKPYSIGRIVWWFVILLEFDFTILVKPGRSHQRSNHLSRITNGEAPIGVNDDLPDSTLFKVESAPRWSEHILEVLSTSISWQRENNPLSIAQLEESQHYVLLSGRLYRLGPDKVLRLCLDPDCYDDAMNETHVSTGGLHASTIQTKPWIRTNLATVNLLWARFFWRADLLEI